MGVCSVKLGLADSRRGESAVVRLNPRLLGVRRGGFEGRMKAGEGGAEDTCGDGGMAGTAVPNGAASLARLVVDER